MKQIGTKLMGLLLACVMLIVAVACTAAGTQTTTAEQQPAATDAPATAKSYQLTGVYAEDGQGASRMTAGFKLDLNEDGTAVCDRYRYLEYDHSDAASNPSYDDAFMTGTWKAVQKDGVDCLQIKLACKNEDGTEANAFTGYAYEIAGEYTLELDFPIVVGMEYKRTVTLTGSETKLYATDNDLIEAYKVDEPEPEPEPVATEEPAKEEPAEKPEYTGEPCPYAGEYDVEYVGSDGKKSYFEEFVIEEDWSLHGVVETSGMTGFEGTVDENGHFTAYNERLGGVYEGDVDLDGNLSGTAETRGRSVTYTGTRY